MQQQDRLTIVEQGECKGLRIANGICRNARRRCARQLHPLRDEGVLIMGSGNIVHNLHAYAWGGHPMEPYDWAIRFESRARRAIEAGEHSALIDYASRGKDAFLSVLTPEHYLPLLYVLGAEGESVSLRSKVWTAGLSLC